jgi:hypothetical protein
LRPFNQNSSEGDVTAQTPTVLSHKQVYVRRGTQLLRLVQALMNQFVLKKLNPIWPLNCVGKPCPEVQLRKLNWPSF